MLHTSKLPAIPVLTHRDIKFFLKYFRSIDQILCQRYSLGFCPDEEHLTSILCELLDDRGSQLHQLPYSIADLNRDLENSGSLLKAEVSLETKTYDKYQERHFTQSDLGIILEYKDRIDPKYNFTIGILVQAKRLFPDARKKYSFASKYNSFDADQYQRFKNLINYFENSCDCSECGKYLLYNPIFRDFAKNEKEKILHCQLLKDRNTIFQDASILNQYREIYDVDSELSLLPMGSLIVSLQGIQQIATKQGLSSNKNSINESKLLPFTLQKVVEKIDIYQSSLPWFIVAQMMVLGKGCSCEEFTKLVTAGRDSNHITQNFEFLPPRYSLRIALTAGEEHPEEFEF
ncbi:MAG: hypothetical protein RMX96_05225 [Nostoc sp. ChiSLP02]|nr:hypothetical protein [Nostoc sp. DedSLP05]MDZ8103676.1 hypothetical protein [Nostoc sp. DedSLP01]MDZ8184251.1 hypothetical protein [Nostoc sp. ChiSLP02]